jgi:hypothetical protein
VLLAALELSSICAFRDTVRDTPRETIDFLIGRA